MKSKILILTLLSSFLFAGNCAVDDPNKANARAVLDMLIGSKTSSGYDTPGSVKPLSSGGAYSAQALTLLGSSPGTVSGSMDLYYDPTTVTYDASFNVTGLTITATMTNYSNQSGYVFDGNMAFTFTYTATAYTMVWTGNFTISGNTVVINVTFDYYTNKYSGTISVNGTSYDVTTL